MALKQCQSRFGVCRFNHVKTRIDPASGQNRVYEPPRRTTFSSSAGLCCGFTASLSSLEQPLLRLSPPLGWRGVSALRQTSLREINTSTKTLQYDLKPDVPKAEGRMLFFDTHAVVRLLEDNGFSTEQAEVIVKVLVRTTSTNMDIIYSDMVTKVQQEITLQQVMSKIAAVKKDMVILERSEFSTLLGENEKLKNQLFQLKIQLTDVMNKMRSDNLLDMNVEKSLVKELKAEHDKKLLETRTEIMEMTAEQDRHLTQTNMKIDTEVAGLKTMLESHKLDTIKYLAGSVFTCLTVVLGFYRVWM